MSKICSKCYIEKNENEYYKNHRHSDGLASECKDCRDMIIKNYKNKNKNIIRKKNREHYWGEKHDEILKKNAIRYHKNSSRFSDRNKRDGLKRKLKCFNYYSNNNIKCICCGETEISMMQLDHINNDGYKHRKTLRDKNGGACGGSRMYRWIIKNDFPPIFQVLCANCNMSKMLLGRCAHKQFSIMNKDISHVS